MISHLATVSLLLIALAWPPPEHQVMLVCKGKYRQDGPVLLEPVTPALIGVEWRAGSREIQKGDILRCTASNDPEPADVGGERVTLNQIVLDCGNTKLNVTGIEFNPR